MKLAIDTNVVLDLLLNRAPFADAAAAVFTQIESGAVTACVCANTIITRNGRDFHRGPLRVYSPQEWLAI
jgi:predicted nucleic acid-binding protein